MRPKFPRPQIRSACLRVEQPPCTSRDLSFGDLVGNQLAVQRLRRLPRFQFQAYPRTPQQTKPDMRLKPRVGDVYRPLAEPGPVSWTSIADSDP